jgi:hypothetical protein
MKLQRVFGLSHIPANGHVTIQSPDAKKLLKWVDDDNILVEWNREFNLWLTVDDLTAALKPDKTYLKLI